MTSVASRTRRGTSSDAPNVSSATRAKPSTFERSNDGTSTGETTSAASTRPSAASRATVSIPRGVRSTAARKRRSASSRSTTLRNCSCSRIEPDLDLGPSGVPFTVLLDDDEAVGARGRREHRGAGHRQWFEARPCPGRGGEPHACVIQAADGRADLAGECPAHRTIRPLLRASAQGANRAAGEEVVGAERRHGIAGKQEDQARVECAHARRAARTHGDAVYGELAVLRHQRGRKVLYSNAGAAGPAHHVHVGA